MGAACAKPAAEEAETRQQLHHQMPLLQHKLPAAQAEIAQLQRANKQMEVP